LEERVRDFYFEELGLAGNCLSTLGILGLLLQKLLLPLLCCLVHDLISGLLKFVILEIESLFERIRLFGAAIASECVKDFRQLCLADNGVLQLAYCLISEDNVTFVHTKFKWQE